MITGKEILHIPLDSNASQESGSETVGGYLIRLAELQWRRRDGIDGKRPFGTGGWRWDIWRSLAKAGVVPGVTWSGEDDEPLITADPAADPDKVRAHLQSECHVLVETALRELRLFAEPGAYVIAGPE